MKECEVKIQIPVKTREQLIHIFRAEDELRLAGINFDSGYDFLNKIREWEFDVVKGAKVLFKRFK